MRESAVPAAIHTPDAAHLARADRCASDAAFRAPETPAFRVLHDRYWRVEMSGVRRVPRLQAHDEAARAWRWRHTMVTRLENRRRAVFFG